MKALILAGGFATRLWPLTEKRAKPLVYINGKPIISHLVESLPNDMDIIVSTNKVFEKDFLEWQRGFPDRNVEIFIEDSGSDDFKKGALGATALVIKEKNLDEDLMLLAGDNLFGFDMKDFIDSYKENPIIAVYDVKDLNEAKKFGIVITDEEKVIDFQEKPVEPKSTLASTGCYIFPKKNLEDVICYAKKNNDDLGGVFEYLLSQGETIHYFSFSNEWYDIGSFSAYISAHKSLQGENHIIHDSVDYDDDSNFFGAVFIAKETKIQNSVIENSIIMDGCYIENCVIRDSVIDKNCILSGIDLHSKIIRETTEIKVLS